MLPPQGPGPTPAAEGIGAMVYGAHPRREREGRVRLPEVHQEGAIWS